MSDRQRLADKLGMKHWDDELLAMFALEKIEELHGDVCRLRDGLTALNHAGSGVTVAAMRSVAYDIALNCIPGDVAEFQLLKRSGLTET